MPHPSLADLIIFHGRNVSYRRLFGALRRTCAGDVLDIGGGFFYAEAVRHGVSHRRWVTLEPGASGGSHARAQRRVAGDGCCLPFADASFDTILCIHVLEHVFRPIRVVDEVRRALRPGGTAVFMVPQTAGLHSIPHIYYNFTPYWIERAMRECGLSIQEHHYLGGVWSTAASHMAYFLFKMARLPGYTERRFTGSRSFLHYLLSPLMVAAALLLIPLGLLFSLGDLREEANNHLVVVRRPMS